MEELELEYVSMVLINGQILITKMKLILDDNDCYTIFSPMKPIILPESNKIALMSHNPFSESIEFQIHASMVMTIGALDINYIQMFDDAVDALMKKTKASYDKFLGNDEIDDDEDEIQNVKIELPATKTLH